MDPGHGFHSGEGQLTSFGTPEKALITAPFSDLGNLFDLIHTPSIGHSFTQESQENEFSGLERSIAIAK